jgi:integrase
VVEFLDRLERERGLHHQVNRCRETLRMIFAFAIERELVTANPVIGVSKRKEIPRDRTLSNNELAALWNAIERLPVLPQAYFRVVLLTGARRNEVGRMAWSELDLDAALWRLPAARPSPLALGRSRVGAEVPNCWRSCRRLCTRDERPSGRSTACERDEIAPSHGLRPAEAIEPYKAITPPLRITARSRPPMSPLGHERHSRRYRRCRLCPQQRKSA